jgi:hypothetical protein
VNLPGNALQGKASSSLAISLMAIVLMGIDKAISQELKAAS